VYHLRTDAGGTFINIWENRQPTGTADFIMHREALAGLVFDLGAGMKGA
jgi:hypothetical protein